MNQDLALEKYMTVKEVSESLKTPLRTVHDSIDRLFPGLKKNGKTTYLNEKQVTAISMDLKRAHNVDLAATRKDATTDLEMELMVQKVVLYQQEKINTLMSAIEHKDAIIEEQRPKADFYDRVTQSDDTYDIGEVAKILNIPMVGRNNLFKILRGMGLLMETREPYQRYVDRGYFKLVQADTHLGTMPKVVVYQKGIDYIMRRIEEEKNEGN